jgi:6-methylsalicylate decarboxylase
MRVDVHQHLWPDSLLEALRQRLHAPRMAGWTIVLDGEPDFAVDPADHDVARRQAQSLDDGLDLVLVSPSSPLGIEWLAPEEALPLLDAYHEGVLALPAPFLGWASVCLSEVDPVRVERELLRGCVGLQLPATALQDAEGYERCAPLLDLIEARGRPLFIHPGAAPPAGGRTPTWWPAMVPYVQQMHAAWFAFRAFGRPRHPRLRVCFAMLAGLAPLHGERLRARGNDRGAVDPKVFVESSSYGTRAVDAIVRVLGVDAVVLGSDRPYASPADLGLGSAAAIAMRSKNPAHFLDVEGVMG